jgi:hypothetical protein
MWESFPDGGCWTFKLSREDERLNSAWEDSVLSCVGEGLGSHNVAGIVLASRPREFSISVWLVSATSPSLRFEVLDHLKQILKLHEGDILQYKDFQSSIKDDSSKVNALTYRVKAQTTSTPWSAVGKPIESHAPGKKYQLPDPVTGSFTFKY